MTWTDERVAQLRKLWTEGLSAAGVARALGEDVSRSAVLGKLQRLGLLGARKPASAPRGFGEAGAVFEPQKLAAAFRLRKAPGREPPPSPWREEALRPLPGTSPRPWLTRGAGECAFPVGGEGEHTLSCCAPRQGGSDYCPRHHALAFRRAPPLSAPPEEADAEALDRRAA